MKTSEAIKMIGDIRGFGEVINDFGVECEFENGDVWYDEEVDNFKVFSHRRDEIYTYRVSHDGKRVHKVS